MEWNIAWVARGRLASTTTCTRKGIRAQQMQATCAPIGLLDDVSFGDRRPTDIVHAVTIIGTLTT
jgi:hypothetical protein